MTESHDTDEQQLALATLLLDNPEPPVGEAPTTAELWDWMHGSLSLQRAAEVETHVARDPDIFEQWRQLRQAESEFGAFDTQASSSDQDVDSVGWWQRIRDAVTDPGLHPARGLAVGLTMVVVFVAAGLLRQTPGYGPGIGPEFWVDWQSPKHSSASNVSAEQQAHLQLILSGIADHLRELQQPQTGPDGEELPVAECRVANDCDDTSEILFDLGQRAAVARSRCLTEQSLPADDWLIQTLSALEKTNLALVVHKPLRSWVEASSSAGRCVAADTLISRALSEGLR